MAKRILGSGKKNDKPDPGSTKPVTRQDIENKLRELTGEVGDTAQAAKPYVAIAGAAATVLLLSLAYLTGRRRGRKKTTVVEIRRV